MLEVRLEVDGEVHECHPCGHGCRSCSSDEGCIACDSFYVLLPEGTGCTLSWLRAGAVALLGLIIIIPVCALCYWSCADEVHVGSMNTLRHEDDPAEVVRGIGGEKDLRRRGGRQETSPRREGSERERAGSGGVAYPLLPGYH